MARSGVDTATAAAMDAYGPLYPIWFIRMDVQVDPIYVHTGLGDLVFPGGSGYDPNIVGFTFKGIGNVGSIDPVTDDISGSQTLSLSLPGVGLTSDYLNQFINNGDLWQRYGAWLWLALTDNTGAIIGKPFRVKSARMDSLDVVIDPGNKTGTITVSLESQQAYNGQALFSRYSEQSQIDATDTSQNYVADLANKVPTIGNPSTNASALGVAGQISGVQVGS